MLDPLRNSTWRLFLTAHTRLIARIEQNLTAAKLPPLEWYDVLFALKEAEGYRLRLSELAERVLLSRSNLTRLVDRLEKAELLRREPCPSDRRGTFAILTETGLTMQQQMWVVYSEGIADYFASHLNDDEVKTLQVIFQRLLGVAD
ncbi:MarR family winged helix-turn-helix transcriptional regulator [Oscillatoria sp. FACHB-1407]|uniref:MarR family winged helix-turn-helix transcriptional regulator n=1 Tax=Oscillatoria sp. FACHB-1407 TaxID=2692847 RepID=UPI0018EFE7D6|nr:MarR family transcriptional regulator [Oscillatoria sp. FACHB-1407]